MKKLLFLMLFLLSYAVVFSQTSTPPSNYATSDGSSGDPYFISSLNNLYWLSQTSTEWDKYYIQTADIDASSTSIWNGGEGFPPIGNGWTTRFTGSYDGDNFTISGLTIQIATDYAGLFGSIQEASISNLGVTNINIEGANDVGGLVGENYISSTITNCYTTGSVTGNGFYIGGLVGNNSVAEISNCYSTASVTGLSISEYVGGLVGQNYQNSVITECYSTGNVSGKNSVGGFVGYNYNSTINICYSTGDISSYNGYTGGFAGVSWNSTISNSYSRGNITRSSGAEDTYAAFCGTNSSTIEYCYSTGSVSYTGATNPTDKGFAISSGTPTYLSNFWDSQASNQSTATGATGKTTNEMNTPGTFITGGWDFIDETINGTDDYWGHNINNNDGYPFLYWQGYTNEYSEINLKQGTADIADGGTYDYGEQDPGTDTDIIFTIENLGTGSLTFTTPIEITGTNSDQFSIESQPISPVAASGNTTFTVRFSPTSAGSKTASIAIANNDSDEDPYDLTLNGTGTDPEINLKQGDTNIADGGTYNYGDQNTGTDTDIIFTIQNTGTGPLTFTTPITITGTDAGQFSIQNQPTSPIAAGGNTTFTVRFSPATIGAKSASISINNNDTNEDPYDLNLIGNGTVPEINLKQGTTNIDDGGTYDYGEQDAGTDTDIIFTIENLGTGVLTFTTPLSITGTNSDQFSIQNQPTSPVAASGNTTFTVRFSPTSAGSKTASIAIANNDSDEDPYNLTLNGNGVEGTQPPGTGSQESPYQVSLLDHLLWISTQPSSWDKYFEQTVDIDATNTNTWNSDGEGGYYGFSPIGNVTTKFTGEYNGNNHSISNLFINRGSAYYVALFGFTDGASIEDLGLTNINISGGENVGSLVGKNNYTSKRTAIENCYSTGVLLGSTYYHGGLVGYSDHLDINGSYSTVTVTGNSRVGGLVGYNDNSSIESCHNTGDISGSGLYVGGLVGYNNYSNINRSLSTGNVSSSGNYVGGLVGQSSHTSSVISNSYCVGNVTRTSGTNSYFAAFCGGNTGTVQYCYSIGSVYYTGTTDPTDKGFISVDMGTGTTTNNFWDSQASNQSTAIGATAKTNVEMKTPGTYTSAYWDFMGEDVNGSDDYWGHNISENNGYPFLDWQGYTNVVPTSPEMNLKQGGTDIADGGTYGFGGNAVGSDTDIVFTIENTGAVDLILSTPLTISGADAFHFSIESQPTTPITPSSSTTFTVRFSPQSSGAKTASIAIGNNDDDEHPYDLNITGTGTVPEINLKQGATDIDDGDTYDFGSKSTGTDTDVVFTIENIGAADLTLTTSLTITGTNADQFSIQADPTSPVAPGANTNFTVRFSPTSAGAKTASIAIANNDTDENPYDLTLNGTGEVGTQPPGSGTSGDPYLVSLLDHLLWISTNSSSWDKYFEQTADIDASSTSSWNSGAGFSPIGNFSTYFTGNYNGNYFTIDGLTIDIWSDNTGFFGYTSSAVIQNLGVTNVDIVSTRNQVGALVGWNSNYSTITNCYSTGSVTGYYQVGGLVGYNTSQSTIHNCYSTVSVSGSGDTIGGLVGYYSRDFPGFDDISNCYSMGDVTRTDGNNPSYAAFCGYNSDGGFKNCYSIGSVFSTGGDGPTKTNEINTDPTDKGFVGTSMNSPTYSGNFWDSEASNQSTATGATAKTTAEMKTDATFKSAGWDFVGETDNGSNDYWNIDESDIKNSGYPYLAWQYPSYPEINLKQGSTDIVDGGTYNFGSKNTGTENDVVFTIENTGNADLTFTTPLSITGTNTDQFSIQTNPTSPVAPGGNTTFTVRFSPTSAGAKTASITIANNDSDENPYDLTLNGTGAAPEINLKQGETNIADGGSYNFGRKGIGTDTESIFTIENLGTADLSITVPLVIVGIDADQFRIQENPPSLIPSGGGSAWFSVYFNPTSTGSKTASIAIANNDADENPYDLTLTGECANCINGSIIYNTQTNKFNFCEDGEWVEK